MLSPIALDAFLYDMYLFSKSDTTDDGKSLSDTEIRSGLLFRKDVGSLSAVKLYSFVYLRNDRITTARALRDSIVSVSRLAHHLVTISSLNSLAPG